MELAGVFAAEDADASCDVGGLGTVVCGFCASAGAAEFSNNDMQQSAAAVRTMDED